LQRSHHQTIEAIDVTFAGQHHQLHAARLPRFEAHRRSRRDVEPETARRRAVENQRGIGFGKVIVRTDLDRPVAGVGNGSAGSFRDRH
jgi:hypothetical protein